LLDIERVAPCMPGAKVDSVDGDDFTGTVKVKLGPIALTYKGKASFTEKDESAHRAVIDARGRDARGNGTAAAKVSATLHAESESSTRVDVVTDLDITGKPAQFGRGVMVDVGNKLIGQFADRLACKLAGGEAEAEPAAEESTREASAPPTEQTAEARHAATRAEQPRPAPQPASDSVEPINLIESVGPALAKRFAPVLGALVVLLVVSVLRRKRRGRLSL
jgi:carbon monoxide dehydrogenase subunit G